MEEIQSRGVMTGPTPKLSILMPVRNEGINLRMMLKILKATIEVPHELLIIYDSLEDDSVPVVESMKRDCPQLRGVHNTLGRGVKNAIQAGIDASLGEYLFVIAADDIGPVLTIEDMLSLMEEGCDLVSATRYAHGGRVLGGATMSRFLSRLANRLFYWISGIALTDSTVGIKMFRRSVFKKIKLDSNIGWSAAFELAIKCQLEGMRLGEVPIISINRFYGGNSSFKVGPWVVQYSRLFLWGVVSLYKSGKLRPQLALRIPQKIGLQRVK